jgi:hypothetical protein
VWRQICADIFGVPNRVPAQALKARPLGGGTAGSVCLLLRLRGNRTAVPRPWPTSMSRSDEETRSEPNDEPPVKLYAESLTRQSDLSQKRLHTAGYL